MPTTRPTVRQPAFATPGATAGATPGATAGATAGVTPGAAAAAAPGAITSTATSAATAAARGATPLARFVALPANGRARLLPPKPAHPRPDLALWWTQVLRRTVWRWQRGTGRVATARLLWC